MRTDEIFELIITYNDNMNKLITLYNIQYNVEKNYSRSTDPVIEDMKKYTSSVSTHTNKLSNNKFLSRNSLVIKELQNKIKDSEKFKKMRINVINEIKNTHIRN